MLFCLFRSLVWWSRLGHGGVWHRQICFHDANKSELDFFFLRFIASHLKATTVSRSHLKIDKEMMSRSMWRLMQVASVLNDVKFDASYSHFWWYEGWYEWRSMLTLIGLVHTSRGINSTAAAPKPKWEREKKTPTPPKKKGGGEGCGVGSASATEISTLQKCHDPIKTCPWWKSMFYEILFKVYFPCIIFQYFIFP